MNEPDHPPTARLRVAVDATALLDRPTGVGVFAREVLAGAATDPSLDVTACAITWRGRGRLRSVVPPGVVVRTRPVPARVARTAWSRGEWPTIRDLAGPCEVVHGPNFVVPPGGGAAEIATVHDLTALRYPKLCTADVLAWPGLLRRAIARGAWVHAVSESVAEEVRAAFAIDPARVVAVPNGVHRPPPPTPATDAARGRHLAGDAPYVLAVGTIEPRKDLPGLVAAFDEVAALLPDLRLVLAGPDGWGADQLTDAIDRSAHRRRIVRLGWVDDEARLALLRGAAVLAYPSRYEGFGLPPLEAMAVGTPVVATAVGALPEVIGDAGLLVPGADPGALAGALRSLVVDVARRAWRVVAGGARVDAYPWSATVEGIVALYRRAAVER